MFHIYVREITGQSEAMQIHGNPDEASADDAFVMEESDGNLDDDYDDDDSFLDDSFTYPIDSKNYVPDESDLESVDATIGAHTCFCTHPSHAMHQNLNDPDYIDIEDNEDTDQDKKNQDREDILFEENQLPDDDEEEEEIND